ncbi:MAG: VIT1/CCC1 transporter family protein [Nitrososphaeraceae archaeon]
MQLWLEWLERNYLLQLFNGDRNYLGNKSQKEYIEKEKRREEWEIDNLVEQEKQEIKDINKEKGFKEEILEEIVRVITS